MHYYKQKKRTEIISFDASNEENERKEPTENIQLESHIG